MKTPNGTEIEIGQIWDIRRNSGELITNAQLLTPYYDQLVFGKEGKILIADETQLSILKLNADGTDPQPIAEPYINFELDWSAGYPEFRLEPEEGMVMYIQPSKAEWYGLRYYGQTYTQTGFSFECGGAIQKHHIKTNAKKPYADRIHFTLRPVK